MVNERKEYFMLTERQKAARNREGVRRWYDENRDDYNALRRERYALNKGTRDKATERAAIYRAEREAGRKIERKMTREHDGKTVIVLSTGQVAALLDRTPQMLRNWERDQKIPESVFPDEHRLYTKQQARLLVTLLNSVKRSGGWDTNAVAARVAHTFSKW